MRDSGPGNGRAKEGAGLREAQCFGEDHPHQGQITGPASRLERVLWDTYVSAWHNDGRSWSAPRPNSTPEKPGCSITG
jgi:hypothetical protein